MSRTMTYADKPIVQAYAELKDVDKVARHLKVGRERVVEVVLNVCGISPTAARGLLAGRAVNFLADRPTAAPEPEPRYELTPTRPADITNREHQILVALSEGLSYEQIAYRINRSQHTVKSHVATAFRKLGALNRDQAIRAALELAVIEPPATAELGESASTLSEAEREKLRMAATRMPYGDIAEHLNVSVTCVRSRLSRTYAKLGVRRLPQAVDVAVRAGILVLPSSEVAA